MLYRARSRRAWSVCRTFQVKTLPVAPHTRHKDQMTVVLSITPHHFQMLAVPLS
jgi:hypothetical protein